MDKKRVSTPQVKQALHAARPTRGLFYGVLILGALLAFELFNYSTTEFALTDLMGDLRFLDLRWATILALAFCGIDFAGIARLFTPEKGTPETREVWYLFGAWLLAASMNAMLTWWGVAIALLDHTSQGGTVVSSATMLKVVPVFVAIMVWLIRVLIIGSFSLAGNRMFSQAEAACQVSRPSLPQPATSQSLPTLETPFHPLPKPDPQPTGQGFSRSDHPIHPASMSSPNQHHPEIRK